MNNMMDYNNPNDLWRRTGYDPYKGMSDDEKVMAGCMQVISIIIGAFVALIICMLFGSCKSVEYIEVPVVHNDTTIVTKHQRDSIWMHDSVLVSEKGDTVRIEKWHTKYIAKEVHDTLYQARVDSVPYPVEVIKEVPAKLTWWQQTRLHLANILLFALLLGIIIWIGKRHLKMLGG